MNGTGISERGCVFDPNLKVVFPAIKDRDPRAKYESKRSIARAREIPETKPTPIEVFIA